MNLAANQVGGLVANPAYDALKQLILSCELKPGERLVEAAVAQKLGMSRGVVHQAFDRLMFEELVDVIPRKGVIVKPVVLAELLQMAEVRRLNEVHSARKAAELATTEQIEQIGSIVEAASRAVEQSDLGCMIRMDRAFHKALAECSNNSELSAFIERLNERSSRYWFLSTTTQDHHLAFQAQHVAIYNALRSRLPEAAEAAMAAHIDSFRESLLRQACR